MAEVSQQLKRAYDALRGLSVPVVLPEDDLPAGDFVRLSLVSGTFTPMYQLSDARILAQVSAFADTYLGSLGLAEEAAALLRIAGLEVTTLREGAAEVGSHHLTEVLI